MFGSPLEVASAAPWVAIDTPRLGVLVAIVRPVAVEMVHLEWQAGALRRRAAALAPVMVAGENTGALLPMCGDGPRSMASLHGVAVSMRSPVKAGTISLQVEQ
jgi:hypothetical protein